MFPEHKLRSEYFFPLFADDLFCDLTPKSLKSLDKIKQTKQFEKDVCFFSSGEIPRCFYILRKGKAQLLLNDIHIVRLIEPNEILGLTVMIADMPCETDAETITPCICEFIKREDFIRFLRNEPEVSFRLVRMLGLHLQKNRQLFFSSIN